MLGTVVTGWLFLDLLGTAATLKLLTALSSLFLLGAWRGAPPIPLALRLGVAAAVVMLIVSHAGRRIAVGAAARHDGRSGDRRGGQFRPRGHQGSKRSAWTGQKIVFVNGVGQSVIPYGDIHTALGAVPALVHPNPRNVAIIGLGSGDTVYAAAARPETATITCIEIVRPQLATLRQLAGRDTYAALPALLADPRVAHVSGDGRAYLLRTPQRFDVIEADALRPTSAYSGNLYSEAYFTLLKNRLTPNGLAATWVPSKRVHDTFVRVFPYGVSLPGILLGSSQPFDIDRALVAARVADPRVRDAFPPCRRRHRSARPPVHRRPVGAVRPRFRSDDAPRPQHGPVSQRRIRSLAPMTDLAPAACRIHRVGSFGASPRGFSSGRKPRGASLTRRRQSAQSRKPRRRLDLSFDHPGSGC